MFSGKIVIRDAYCSPPPISTSFRPPRLSRAEEAVRPRSPLRPCKREVRESEAESIEAEFIVDEQDEIAVKVERPVKVEPDPRQIVVGIAAISIR